MSSSNANLHYLPVREDWLARHTEAALDPALPIVDPHHHLWDRPHWRYLLPELLADTNQGHNIVSTVFVQARAMHRADGPEAYQPVGETEFVNGIAAMSASGGYGATKVCEGIVGHVNLMIGMEAKDVLQAHIRAGGGRFRGIRHITSWDPDPVIMNPAYTPPQDIYFREDFRAGFAQLAPLGLSFDAWLYHPQIPDLTALARAFPETPIVLDHVGGPLGIRAYAGRRDEVFATWRASMAELATCPNVCVKLGGLGMRINGFGFEDAADPPSSDTLAAAWKPYMHATIELFGATRCMFESNFPVDKGSYSYGVFWNACKKLAAGASAEERTALFSGTASRFYKLGGA
jgi:predicted TIM-barrel fold metal-dependent hydrolase